MERGPNYATNPARTERRDEVWEHLRPVFAERSTAEWIAALEEVGVPAGPIYRMDEVFADPQVRHLGMAAAGRTPCAARGPARRPAREPFAHSGVYLCLRA
jgi:crotonobetainyl-CoA:carnitine CoA-transferase CaiB-like acyl-CoA transferase